MCCIRTNGFDYLKSLSKMKKKSHLETRKQKR